MSNALEHDSSVLVLASTSIGFAMMCVGMFMAILDVQVVATSLPTIQSALDIPPDQMSWVQTAYLIAEVIAIPLTSFLTRLLSMCGLFVLSISVFTLASVERQFRHADRVLTFPLIYANPKVWVKTLF